MVDPPQAPPEPKPSPDPKTPPDPETAAAQLRKLIADARSAEAKALQDERDTAEANSTVAKAKRDAEARKATAEASKAAATARREEIAALIPDFSKVTGGTLDSAGDQALFGVPFANAALGTAAELVVTDLSARLGKAEEVRVLVTSDDELAASDTAYIDVTAGLEELTTAASKVIAEIVKSEGDQGEQVAPMVIAGALASAVPGVLSLFSARRKLTSAAVSTDDLAAAAATIGAAKKAGLTWTVVHDDVRIISADSGLLDHVKTLRAKRESLTTHKIALEGAKSSTTRDLELVRAEIQSLTGQLAEATTDGVRAQLRSVLSTEESKQAAFEDIQRGQDLLIGLVDSTTQAIDAFSSSLTAVPPGAKLSPLGLALLHAQLHSATGFTHVLLVKGSSGAVNQTLSDRPLWFKDKFTVMASVGLTYLLIAASNSSVVAAGTVVGTASGHGDIGSNVTVTTNAT